MTSPLSILVIGVGSIGERHLRCFQATGRAEVSFVEINESLRATIADVRVILGDTERTPYASNSWGSMTTASVGPAVRAASKFSSPARWRSLGMRRL